MSSQLTRPSIQTPVEPAARAHRAFTLSLEIQSAYKVALAVVIGAATLAVHNPIGFIALLMLMAAVIAGYSLSVLAADARSRRSLRVYDYANTDGVLAAILAVIAFSAALAAADNAAVIAASGAIVLAALRLRTRYTA